MSTEAPPPPLPLPLPLPVELPLVLPPLLPPLLLVVLPPEPLAELPLLAPLLVLLAPLLLPVLVLDPPLLPVLVLDPLVLPEPPLPVPPPLDASPPPSVDRLLSPVPPHMARAIARGIQAMRAKLSMSHSWPLRAAQYPKPAHLSCERTSSHRARIAGELTEDPPNSAPRPR
jgi:hypothetical protein